MFSKNQTARMIGREKARLALCICMIVFAAAAGAANLLASSLPFRASADHVSAKHAPVNPGDTRTAAVWQVLGGTAETGNITGRVTDPSGRAAAGIQVECWKILSDWGRINIRTTTSDSSGDYYLVDLPAGRYQIFFSTERYNRKLGADLLSEWYSGQFDSGDVISLDAGRTLRGIGARLKRGSAISGHVRDDRRRPAANVTVTVTPEPAGWPSLTATTGVSGHYQVRGLRPGAYRVHFSSGEYEEQWFDGQTEWSAADRVILSEGEERRTINATLARFGRISGRLTDGTGAALAGVEVGCWKDGAAWFVSSDEEGNYRSPGLPAGSYLVCFTLNQANPPIVEYYDNQAESIFARQVNVQAGQEVGGIDARLNDGGRISGTVNDWLEGVVVHFYTDDGQLLRRVRTNSSGYYDSGILPAGTYRVYFEPPAGSGYAPQWYRMSASQDSAEPVTVAAGEDQYGIDATLQQGGRVAGQITGQSGQPAGEALVLIMGNSGTQFTNSDAEGLYRFESLAPGDYRLQVLPPAGSNLLPQWYDHQSDEGSADLIPVRQWEETRVDLVLETGGSISGRLLDNQGQGIGGIRCQAWDSITGAVAAESSSGETGDFQVIGLATGQYQVYFQPDGLAFQGEWFDDQTGQDGAVTLTVTAGTGLAGVEAVLDRWGGMTGHVYQPDGQPVPDTRVVCSDQQGQTVKETVTTPDGYYRLEVPPGRYRLHFIPPWGGELLDTWYGGDTEAAAAVIEIEVERLLTGIDARLRTGGRIAGRVTDFQDQPVSIEVNCFDEQNQNVATAFAGVDGQYILKPLRTGRYKVYFGNLGYSIFLPEWYQNRRDRASADWVMVSGDETAGGIDARLDECGAITGTVRDTAGAALADIQVIAEAVDGYRQWYAFTDEEGRYACRGIAPGEYTLQFHGQGFETGWYRDRQDPADADRITITEGTVVTDADTHLNRLGVLRGRVTDSTGQGIGEVRVYAHGPDGISVQDRSTDADGNYLFDFLDSGIYKVYFEPLDDHLPQWYAGQTDPAAADPVPVLRGSVTVIDAVLARPAKAGGLVTGRGGEVVAGVTVQLWNSQQELYQEIQTGDDGRYLFSSVPAGSYRLYFNAAGTWYMSVWHAGKPGWSSADPIEVKPDQDLNIDAVLDRNGSISGKVISSLTGSGLGGVQVRLLDRSGTEAVKTLTGGNGEYETGPVQPGVYRVEFSLAGYVMQYYQNQPDLDSAREITSNPEQAIIGIDAALVPCGRIQGKVCNRSGNGIPGIWVTAASAANGMAGAAKTDSGGVYLLENLAPGQYKLHFIDSSGGRYRPEWYNGKLTIDQADPVQVNAGQTLTGIDACLAEFGCIEGTVASRDGRRIAGVQIGLWDTSGVQKCILLSGADGSFKFGKLAPGVYRLWFNAGEIAGYLSAWYRQGGSLATADPVNAGLDQTVRLKMMLAPFQQPPRPVLRAPAHVAAGIDYRVTWSDVCPDGKYQLQEAARPDFTDAATFELDPAQQSFNHPVLPATLYFYRVRSVRRSGGVDYFSAWSKVVTVRIKP